MKKLIVPVLVFASMLVWTSCSDFDFDQTTHPEVFGVPGANGSTWVSSSIEPGSVPYNITLEKAGEDRGDGTYLWTWKVSNAGSGSSFQDISHLSFADLGTCATREDVVGAGTSDASGNFTSTGINWSSDNSIKEDDGEPCLFGQEVLKIDVGGSVVYYALVVNKVFTVADNAVTVVYKSGNNVGCGTMTVRGMDCEPPVVDGCSLSQGYWFAKPNNVWMSDVTVGGYTYTQAEAKAIWNTSNKGGLSDIKAAFTQTVAIKMSGSTVGEDASVWADVEIVDAEIAKYGKLSPFNIPTKRNDVLKAAAGRISNWINANHCD